MTGSGRGRRGASPSSGRRRRLSGAVTLATLIGLPGCAPPGDGQHSAALDGELAAIVDELGNEHDRFGILFARLGDAGPEVHVAGDIQPHDHLRLASLSKVFAAFVALREGLDPGATIERFYPADRYPASDEITLRMLLDHTSGIPDEFGRRLADLPEGEDPEALFRELGPMMARPAPPPDERIEAIYNPGVGLDFEPGSRWCYTNTGYLMVGRILERVTGRPVEELVAAHLGEVAPSLYLDDGREASFPASYPDPWPIHWSHPWVAGSMVATASDALAALGHVAAQPEFDTMRQWATAPRCDREVVFGDDYGLGLQRYDFGQLGDALGHDGHIGARSLLVRLDGSVYLVHTTRTVGNAELEALARRLLAAGR